MLFTSPNQLVLYRSNPDPDPNPSKWVAGFRDVTATETYAAQVRVWAVCVTS